MESSTKKLSYIILTIIMICFIILVGTYAWLSYRSNDTALVLTIGEINNIQVTLSPYQIKTDILPQVTYLSDNYTNVNATNNSSIQRSIKLYYKINNIDNELINPNFKYTIEKSTDGTTFAEYETGDFSTATNNSELTILEESIPSNTTYKYKVYIWLDGTNTGQSNAQGKSFNGELRAEIEQGTYTVTFKDNLFDVDSNNDFGDLSIDYNKNTTVLTINGTVSGGSNPVLSVVDGLTLNVNEVYDFDMEYISGSVTGNSTAALVSDVAINSSGTNLTPRNNSRRNFISTFNEGFSQTIDENAASNGIGFRFWLWLSGSDSYTFDNYKVKVQFYKKETKEVKYGEKYGELPTPTRDGYTFLGWISGIEVPSKTGGAWVTELVNNSFVTSNFDAGKKYKVEYDVTLNETIPNGWNAGWKIQWGNIGIRTGTNPYKYLIANGTQVLYSLCGSTYNIGDNFHIVGNITMPDDISTGILVYYTGLCGNDSDPSARYNINATFSNIVFYDYDDPYGKVNNNTIVGIDRNHTLTAIWEKN